MKYSVRFFKRGKFVAEQVIAASTKAELKDKYDSCGATVEVKNSEEAHVRFRCGKNCYEQMFVLSNGRGMVDWVCQFEYKLEVVISPYSGY